MSARQQIEVLVADGEKRIREARELIAIMELAGEDLTDEKKAISELETRVARYRAALSKV